MILLQDVEKYYPVPHGRAHVLKKINLKLGRGEKIGILGRNGTGKSTLIRLMGGVEAPTSGVVSRSMSVSWPIAFGGGFQGSLTGRDNVRFICRVYGVSFKERMDFIEDFSELGRKLEQPLKTYSSGMRARLAFALSMAIEFDCFLIDEVVAVGDARFQQKCQLELFDRRRDRAWIIVSHDDGQIGEHCDRACVLQDGRLIEFPDTRSAFDFYRAN